MLELLGLCLCPFTNTPWFVERVENEIHTAKTFDVDFNQSTCVLCSQHSQQQQQPLPKKDTIERGGGYTGMSFIPCKL